MSRRESDHNRRCEDSITECLRAIHDATLRSGFYGRVEIVWQVKDGSIQQDMQVRLEETRRLNSQE